MTPFDPLSCWRPPGSLWIILVSLPQKLLVVHVVGWLPYLFQLFAQISHLSVSLAAIIIVKSASTCMVHSYFIFFYNTYSYLALYIFYVFIFLNCLSLLLNYKLHKGRNFCLFYSLLYFHYFTWPLVDSGFSKNSCWLNKCTISLLY